MQGINKIAAIALGFLFTACGSEFDFMRELADQQRQNQVLMESLRGLKLDQSGALSLVTDKLAKKMDLSYEQSERQEWQAQISADRTHTNIRFLYDGIPTCEAVAKLIPSRQDDHILFQDSLEKATVYSPLVANEKIDVGMAIDSARVELNNQYLAEPQDLQLSSVSSCLFRTDSYYFPVYKIAMATEAAEFQIFIDHYHGRILDSSINSFHLSTVNIRAYATNKLEGDLSIFSVAGMSSPERLENQFFVTSPSGIRASPNSDGNYLFNPDETSFLEASLFVNVNRQYDFFQSLGHSWVGTTKVVLIPSAVIDGSINNALYTPSFNGSPPRIQVGDGDGLRLRNLGTDADVSYHELGHHVVYDTLKWTKGQSLVIHEALADFFAYAFTGNSCLGESICPANSLMRCEVEERCLRTADNDYILNVNTRPEPHFTSQFLSGMLWDLRGSPIPDTELPKLVFKATRYLLERSGYHDFILSLLVADRELYNGAYCTAIYNAAKARGLTDYITKFNCETLTPQLEMRDNSGAEAPTTTVSSGGKKSGCGTIGISSHSRLPMLILTSPLLIILFFKRRKSVQ